MAYGILPTFIVEETVFVIPSITETVPDSILVTYTRLEEGLTATSIRAIAYMNIGHLKIC